MLTGLDRLLLEADLLKELRHERVGLLLHPASVTRDLTHARAALVQAGVSPAIVFGPEHGYGGEAQDMVGVADRAEGGVPVRSLYGSRFEDLSPRPADLARIDRLVIDLQDVGARYYTFVWTAVLALRACARANVRVLVLDRPNPIGADPRMLEGRLQDADCLSFVGLEPMPIRHGLTLGEVVSSVAQADGLSRDQLRIVRVKELDPSAHAPLWDRPFVMPSPNMPTYETALVYPGGCLLEGTNLSDGRGTTRPFEITGAPWVNGERLAEELHEAGGHGFRARGLTFVPTFHKHAGQRCGGVQIHVTDPQSFRPVHTYTLLIALAQRQDPALFRFRPPPYEFVEDVPAFDLLTGSPRAREAILSGTLPEDVAAQVAECGMRERELVRDAVESAERFGS